MKIQVYPNLLTVALLEAAYKYHAELHGFDESKSEDFAIKMGMCDDPLDEEVIAERFAEFIVAARRPHDG